jgi:hypothetical protein
MMPKAQVAGLFAGHSKRARGEARDFLFMVRVRKTSTRNEPGEAPRLSIAGMHLGFFLNPDKFIDLRSAKAGLFHPARILLCNRTGDKFTKGWAYRPR